MTAALYRITLPDGRAYIGVTKNAAPQRFREHCNARSLIGDAIRECGRENVQIEILVRGSLDYIYGLEPKAIIVFRTRSPGGFNLATGGPAGRGNAAPLMSTRQKKSTAILGKKYGPFSAEHRANMSAAHIGRPRSPGMIAKMSATLTGRKLSTETRARMSASRIGKPSGMLGKKMSLASIEKMLATRVRKALGV